jgi:uncharacterized membrane protein
MEARLMSSSIFSQKQIRYENILNSLKNIYILKFFSPPNTQYINPELYQLKKYSSKGHKSNNRRGGGFGNKSGGFNRGFQNKSGGGYGRSIYENGGGFKKSYENNGYSNGNRSFGENRTESHRQHTRFDDRGAAGYSGGSRFQ